MTYGAFPLGSASLGGAASLLEAEVAGKKIKLFYRNILEHSVVLVTSENSSFPAYRLYDRNIGLAFKGNSAPSTFAIAVNQGAIVYPVDTVIIPSGHNLTGLTISLIYSFDVYTYFQACAWVGFEGQMKKTFDLTSAQCWQLLIYNPTAAPELNELFLTQKIELQRGFSYGSDRGMEENINRLRSKAGQVQKIIWGSEKRARRFDFTKISETQRMDLETLRASGYAKNIWIEDLEGELFFAEILGGLGRFKYEPVGRWGLGMNILEVLP
jgi:hypothetical protein